MKGDQRRGLGRLRYDLDFTLVVCPNRNGGLVLILIHRNDFAEVDGEEIVLIQRHIGLSVPQNLPFVESIDMVDYHNLHRPATRAPPCSRCPTFDSYHNLSLTLNRLKHFRISPWVCRRAGLAACGRDYFRTVRRSR
jgi:hypothetical protein